MMRSVVLSAAMLGLGLGLGFLLFHGQAEPPPECPEPQVAVIAEADVESVAGDVHARQVQASLPPSPGAEIEPTSSLVEATSVLESVFATPREEVEYLRGRIKHLEEALTREMETLESIHGSAEDWPEDMDERFQQDAVVKSVNEALLEIGLLGEVSMADCSEFPCLVVGETTEPFENEHWGALGRSGAMQALYGSDTIVGVTGSTNVEDGEGYSFGVAVFPRREAASHRKLNRRLQYRFRVLRPDERYD